MPDMSRIYNFGSRRAFSSAFPVGSQKSEAAPEHRFKSGRRMSSWGGALKLILPPNPQAK
jgi:hypothetical protein